MENNCNQRLKASSLLPKKGIEIALAGSCNIRLSKLIKIWNAIALSFIQTEDYCISMPFHLLPKLPHYF